MNDDELITLMREQRATVLMTSPVEEIVHRGRAVRARPAVFGPPASTGSSTDAIFVIHAAAIPGGAGVAIQVGRETARAADGQTVPALVSVGGLVHASQHCTGS